MKVKLTASQQVAITSIDKSILVTAGAGSGKTLVLVRRFVEILQKQPELSVRNLLAVTYTTKAAKEMRTRIKARLKELYEEAREITYADSTEAQTIEANHWHQCLAEMDSAYIGTIHSLCQSILCSFAIEAGLDPQIEVLDEIERAQLIQESIAETFRQIITLDNSDKRLLAHFSLETMQTFLQLVLKNHLQFDQIAANLANLNSDQLIAEVEKLLTRTQKQLLSDLLVDQEWYMSGNYINTSPFAEAGNKLEDIRRQAAQYFDSIKQFVDSFDDREDIHLQQKKIKDAWQVLLEMANMGAIRVGGNTDSAKEMRAAIKTLIEKCKNYTQNNKKGYGLPLSYSYDDTEKISNEIINKEYWQLWQTLIAIAKQAQVIYAAKKFVLGKLDFDDLIAKTKTILQEPHSKVRQYYNKEFSHILVDEFQDTNLIQAEIITLLAGKNTKLFLIGDDKQSIYKFQGADVSTFNAWKNKNIQALIFEHSFRSKKNIVDFVNNIFSRLLPSQKNHIDYRAKYSALIAQRDADNLVSENNNNPVVEIIQLPDSQPEETDLAESNFIEAALTEASSKSEQAIELRQAKAIQLSSEKIEGRAVANWIKNKVQNGTIIKSNNGSTRAVEYGDFAILTMRNSDLQIFESALSKENIPYVTSGGRTFLERQEVYDLENMLLFLSNPSNSHALLAILRSPMFGISDEIIHNMLSQNSKSLWQILQGKWLARRCLTRKFFSKGF